jgi:CubicO group peptidase (beta-lactamase class C family)
MDALIPCVRLSLAALLSALAAGCGGGASDASAVPAESCSVAQLESQMDTTLAQAVSEVDFSYAVQRQDGRQYSFNRGSSTLQTPYQSASTSKLVSAVIILRLVEQGYLSLDARPQDHIAGWPIGSGDSLFPMTLAQLLNFTSGLAVQPEVEPACLNDPDSNLNACVITIANTYAGNSIIPGSQFLYASTHMHVAGQMAVGARGVAGWQEVFAEFQSQTGLFPSSTFDLPSVANPRIAGGMRLTGEDYMTFLKALRDGLLLNAASMSQLLTDHTASATIAYSPMFAGIGGGVGLGEDWHYGFGLWHECRSTTFNCVPGTRVSSPGALGSYPFWDRSKGYTGIVVREGVFGTLVSGIAIERSVRSSMESWAAC